LRPRSANVRLLTGALLLALLTAACSLVVSTDALQAGDKGIGCGTNEKVCPDPSLPGRGMCVSTTNPTFGCGGDSCGACALPNAVPRCLRDGSCAIATCSGAHDDCNGMPEDGCEIDLSRDEQNCGSCNNVCTADRGATSCSGGACVIVFCTPPYADCDHKYGNGCETNTDDSVAHCGGCNQPCAGTCVSGVCQP
jgi:hypothetical protein